MKCKLCLKEKKLVKAHIIPDCLYKDLAVGNEKRFASGRVMKKVSTKIIQSGPWDREILCKECDTKILSSLENYFKEHFYDRLKNELKKRTFVSVVIEPYVIEDVDLSKIKLFLLSLIWRSSVERGQVCT